MRGGLDDHRDHHAHQNSQNGIRHGNEQILEHGALTQRSHTGVHQAHAGKQDAEAQHDLADVLPFSAAQEHIKNAADNATTGAKVLGWISVSQRLSPEISAMRISWPVTVYQCLHP